jgi:hypothetical protein
VQIPDSGLMSMRAYGKRRGVSHVAVQRAVKLGRLRASIVRDAEGRFLGIRDPELADREWAANTDYTDAPQLSPAPPAPVHRVQVDAPPSDSEDDGSLLHATRREKMAKAKLAELKLAQESGELVPVRDVERKVRDEYAAVKVRLLGIPSRARQALPHLSLADIAAIEALVREALEELAGGAA